MRGMGSGGPRVGSLRGRSRCIGPLLVAVLPGGQVPLDEVSLQFTKQNPYVDRPASAVGVRRGRGGAGIAEHPFSLLGGLTRGKGR